jgi:hypothetical protein
MKRNGMEAELSLHARIKLSTRTGQMLDQPIPIVKIKWPRDRPEEASGGDGQGN